MLEPGSANDVSPQQDNRDDSTMLYEQIADRDYEAQQQADRGQAAYDGEAGDGPVGMLPSEQYPHPLPARKERPRRPNLIAVVAGVVVVAGLVTAGVIVLNGRRTPPQPAAELTSTVATTPSAPDGSTTAPSSAADPTSTGEPVPAGATTSGWTDSKDLQCIGGQSALLLFQTETAKVTICGGAGQTDLSYHGLKRTTGDTIVLPATFQGGEYVANNGT